MKKSTVIAKQMTNQQLHEAATALFPFAGNISVTETVVSGSFDTGDGKPWRHWSIQVNRFPVGERDGGNPTICSSHIKGSPEAALSDLTAQYNEMTTAPLDMVAVANNILTAAIKCAE